MHVYKAIFIMEDDSAEHWLPYERSVVAWKTIPGDPEATIEAYRADREAAMVLTGDLEDDRLVAASSLAGFVAVVDPATPVHEIVILCRNYVMDLLEGSEGEDDGDVEDLKVPKAPKSTHGMN